MGLSQIKTVRLILSNHFLLGLPVGRFPSQCPHIQWPVYRYFSTKALLTVGTVIPTAIERVNTANSATLRSSTEARRVTSVIRHHEKDDVRAAD